MCCLGLRKKEPYRQLFSSFILRLYSVNVDSFPHYFVVVFVHGKRANVSCSSIELLFEGNYVSVSVRLCVCACVCVDVFLLTLQCQIIHISYNNLLVLHQRDVCLLITKTINLFTKATTNTSQYLCYDKNVASIALLKRA